MEFIARLRKFAHAEDAQDLLEYALLVALIALVAVAAITTAGSNVNTIFTQIAAKLVVPSS
jgi:pilus assembly protein Flp/PilA